MTNKFLILGASYGSLFATKLAMAKHDVTLCCRSDEADLINKDGTLVRVPLSDGSQAEISSLSLPGRISASTPEAVSLENVDIVVLAMQEPQYAAAEIRELLEKIALNRLPCISLMNMPPLTFLRRIPNVKADGLRDCYSDASVWDVFDPALFTLCSPDPQAYRPADEGLNVLQVTLPTNFKVAAFGNALYDALLHEIQSDIEAVRYETDEGSKAVPVKMKVHESVFVPMAKWAMLLTGNYRCIQRDGMRSIAEAVHANLEDSRSVYEWVQSVCIELGAASADLVPFSKYAKAAEGLRSPSSAARALFSGARQIERVDMLVQRIGARLGHHHPLVEQSVRLVDERLTLNRREHSKV